LLNAGFISTVEFMWHISLDILRKLNGILIIEMTVFSIVLKNNNSVISIFKEQIHCNFLCNFLLNYFYLKLLIFLLGNMQIKLNVIISSKSFEK